MLQMALAVQHILRVKGLSALPGKHIAMRIGLHTGPVIGGIIGIRCPRYQLFGPNVDLVMAIEPAASTAGVVVSAAFHGLFFSRYQRNVPEKKRKLPPIDPRDIDRTMPRNHPISPASCLNGSEYTTGGSLDGTIRTYLEEESDGALGVVRVEREASSPLRKEASSSPLQRRAR